MFNGKMKAVTFSYDDCTTQDIRLVELLNKYGLKCTFNINSKLLGGKNELVREGVTVRHDKLTAEQVKSVYAGHEVAVHTLTHPLLQSIEDEAVIIEQIEKDRENLEAIAGYDVRCMAYPGHGRDSDRVAEIIRNKTKIKMARTTECTFNFDLQDNLYQFNPTVHHLHFSRIFDLAEEFINLQPDSPKVFYIWGHSFEFDIHNTWDKFEEFLQIISGKDDIFYGTNSEVLL